MLPAQCSASKPNCILACCWCHSTRAGHLILLDNSCSFTDTHGLCSPLSSLLHLWRRGKSGVADYSEQSTAPLHTPHVSCSVTSPGVPVPALPGLAQPDMAFVKVWLLMNKCQHLLVCRRLCKQPYVCVLGLQSQKAGKETQTLCVVSPLSSALWRI